MLISTATECILAIETQYRKTDELVGVVGQIVSQPNAFNVIPSMTNFSVELCASDDGIREQAAGTTRRAIESICQQRGVNYTITPTYAQPGVTCDAAISDLLESTTRSTGYQAHHLMSGATHDASAFADLCPTAMLFVRCADGLSHHPDEAIKAYDGALAVRALSETIVQLSRSFVSTQNS